MTYTSFCVFYDKGTDISLPVFTDSDEDSLAMNRFYSAAAGDIYSYITGLLSDGSMRCRCFFTVGEVGESGAIPVVLSLSYHKRGGGTNKVRLTHYWKGGNIIRKEVRCFKIF